MQYVKPDIMTICVGQAASMGAILLMAGTRGKRYALPYSRILLHQPIGGYQGQATDIDIHAKEILRMKKLMHDIIHKHTGQTVDKISSDTERDYIMTADESKEYGIVDEVIQYKKLSSTK